MAVDLPKVAAKKILIAEDDPIIRSNLVKTLQLEGFFVVVAENGDIALSLANSECPDLILSDMMMPIMDGHEFLTRIRQTPEHAHTPFIFLTARADRSDIREGMKLGADDYLSKPFLRQELLEVVQTQLNRQAARQQRMQLETIRMRRFDPVTELSNRAGFEDAVQGAIARATARQQSLAVVVVTINALHSLRQSAGARLYEQVLRSFAGLLVQLAQYLPADCKLDDVSRICDSSFALCLSDISAQQTGHVVTQLLSELSQAVQIEHTAHYFQPTAGIACFPVDAADALALIQHAEAAEPEPKAGGQLAFYCAKTSAMLCRRMKMLQALHSALANAELYLCYQPQLDAQTQQVTGFEALLRWQHPEFGHVSPAEFIPLAESSGLIIPIGAWVLHQACGQMQQWLAQGFAPMRMAVNLSTCQFENNDLYQQVTDALRATGLPAELLELEITESIAMQNADHVQNVMQRLANDGVVLAMDDFGTGYSSLAYLKGYPLHVLKIDQVFVRHFLTDENDEAIIRVIIALAQSFKLAVIAEGVETAGQAERLKALGCQYFQGYLFSKPLPAHEATIWLQQRVAADGDA